MRPARRASQQPALGSGTQRCKPSGMAGKQGAKQARLPACPAAAMDCQSRLGKTGCVRMPLAAGTYLLQRWCAAG